MAASVGVSAEEGCGPVAAEVRNDYSVAFLCEGWRDVDVAVDTVWPAVEQED